MSDIARDLGLSIATISRVVNGHTNVKEETKRKVLDYIKEKEYTPNLMAQCLSRRESNSVALLVPNIINPFFASLIDNISKIFIEEGYQITLYNTIGDSKLEEKAIKSIVSQQVAGVIAILNDGRYIGDPLKLLKEKNIPVYLLDRDIEGSNLPGVFINNYFGAYKITKKLIEKGNKDIAIITGNLNFLNARERLRGFEDALKDSSIEVSDKNIYEGDYLFESGYIKGKEILKKDHTGVFCSNNLMLYGFLKEFKNSKKKMDIACFEKTEFLDILDIEIESLEVPLEKIAVEIYELFKTKNTDKKVYIEPEIY